MTTYKHAAEIVIRKTSDGYVGGFASQTGKGTKVVSLGKWYGSQMSYKPFARTLAAAHSIADKLTAGTETEVGVLTWALDCGFGEDAATYNAARRSAIAADCLSAAA